MTLALDPQVREWYRPLIESKGFRLATRDVAELRKAADEIYNDRDVRESIYARGDISVPRGDGSELRLRVYRPDGNDGHPVLIYFHGGGFVIHNIESHDSLCRFLAKATGAVTVSVGYRLAPEHPYPAAQEDGAAALAWALSEIGDSGGEPERIVLGGDSAGASIAAGVALMPGAGGINALMLLYGDYGAVPYGESETVRAYADGSNVLPREMLDFFHDLYVPEDADPRDPVLFPGRASDLSGMPPSFVVSAEYDPLRADGEAFAARMAESGAQVKSITAEGMMHGFALLYDKFDRAAELLRKLCADVREATAG